MVANAAPFIPYIGISIEFNIIFTVSAIDFPIRVNLGYPVMLTMYQTLPTDAFTTCPILTITKTAAPCK